jgi:hypothetical protein
MSLFGVVSFIGYNVTWEYNQVNSIENSGAGNDHWQSKSSMSYQSFILEPFFFNC